MKKRYRGSFKCDISTDLISRTYRFAILGMSLSNLLDIQQPQDLFRGLINTLSEYDQSKEKEDGDKPKMVSTKRLFNRGKLGRRTGGFTEYSGSYVDSSGDASYLVMPQVVRCH